MGFYRKRSSRTLKGGKHRAPLAWFKQAEYARVIEILGYPDGYSRDYNRWRELAENEEQSLKRSGLLAVRVTIHPEELLRWAEAKQTTPLAALNYMLAARGMALGDDI